MPQALPFIAAATAEYLGFAAVGQTVAAVTAAVVVGSYQASRARQKARAAASQAQRDRVFTLRGGATARRLVLGTARVGGTLMYAEFVGAKEEFVDLIVAHTHGELNAVLGVYLDDEFIAAADISGERPTTGKYANPKAGRRIETVAVSASATVTLSQAPLGLSTLGAILTTGSGDGAVDSILTPTTLVGNVLTLSAPVTGDVTVTYAKATAGPIRLQFMLGSDSQASSTWSGVSTPKWTSDHRLRGVSHTRALLKIDDEVFATGTPTISVLAQGPVGVYDPRTATTLATSSNPALLAAWYRTLPRAEGGLGVPSTWIDWASVGDAANVCDELINVRKLDGSGYEDVKRYECHTVLDLDQPPADNLAIILSAMAGDFPYTGGLYRCAAGAYRAPSLTLTDDDIAADASIVFSPLSSAYDVPPNIVSAKFFNAAKGYMEDGAREVVNTTYVTDDGAEEPTEIDLPATTDERQANYLMGVALERARPGVAGSVVVTGKGANIALLQTVEFDLSGYSAIAGKVFEVRRRANSWDGRYALELAEVRASTYALDADRFTPPPAVTLPDRSALFNVTNVAGLAAVGGTLLLSDGTRINRALVSWTLHPQAYVQDGGAIELRWMRPRGEWVYGAPVSGSQVQTFIGPLDRGAVVFIEARARNGLGAVSEWVGISHTVLGKAAAPANVSGLTVTAIPTGLRLAWTPSADVDYAETEVHEEASWNNATAPLWKGAASFVEIRWPSAGSHTYLLKHRDTTGNYSASAASTTLTVGAGSLIDTAQVNPNTTYDLFEAGAAGPVSALGAATEVQRVVLGPYPEATEIAVQFTAQVSAQWTAAGPPLVTIDTYLEDSQAGAGVTKRALSTNDFGPLNTLLTLVRKVTLPASTTGWLRAMGEVTALGGGAVGDYVNMTMTVTVHKV